MSDELLNRIAELGREYDAAKTLQEKARIGRRQNELIALFNRAALAWVAR